MTVVIVRGYAAVQILKYENGPIFWTEWNIVMKFCIHIDIHKI